MLAKMNKNIMVTGMKNNIDMNGEIMAAFST